MVKICGAASAKFQSKKQFLKPVARDTSVTIDLHVLFFDIHLMMKWRVWDPILRSYREWLIASNYLKTFPFRLQFYALAAQLKCWCKCPVFHILDSILFIAKLREDFRWLMKYIRINVKLQDKLFCRTISSAKQALTPQCLFPQDPSVKIIAKQDISSQKRSWIFKNLCLVKHS